MDVRMPDKPARTSPLPELANDKVRIYIFMGHEYAVDKFNGPVTLEFNKKSGILYFEETEISYINLEDVYVCDLPEGKHNFSWTPNAWHGTENFNKIETITLDLRKGETVFLEGNTKDHVSAKHKWLSLEGLKGWSHYLEVNSAAGQEALKTRKIVEYRDLSKEKMAAH